MLEGSIDIGKERITLAGPDGCYYRAAVSQGLPFDYSLWPNTKSCNDGNISASCAPTSTEDPFANSDLTLSPAELALKTLPENDAELELFLLKAAQNGQITWISHADNREVYAVLQTEIDSSAKGQDVHLVFGNNHFAEQQAEFFTELITEGRDQLQVQGITHVVWELFNRNNDQSLIDNYLVTGKRHFNIDYGEFLGKDSALAKAKERLAETFLKAVSLECYNLVGSNAELNVPMTFSSANGYFDLLNQDKKQ
ncbi:MAG: hypothetical protein NT099_03415 [Candidatus Saganbacteria bacterium]|nr:hypothetical protein [Candidatus Saganbacteria bacterium]